MEFEVDLGRQPLDGTLHYVEAEYSFRFDVAEPQERLDRAGNAGITSLSVGTLQVEVGVETGIALYVWGLHPSGRWQEDQFGAPHPQPGIARVSDPQGLRRGVSIEIAPVGSWSTFCDPGTGWVWVTADAGNRENEIQVLIADGTALGFRDGRLSSIWLRPVHDASIA
jgi:hypothetical protein